LVGEGKDIYTDFNANLVAFLASDLGKPYYLDIKCDTEMSLCSGVKVSRYLVWNKSITNTDVMHKLSSAMGAKIEELGLDAFV